MEARSLPEALKLIMRQRGWSQTQLARELRRYPSWVSEVISGEKGTNFAKVIKLLERVGWEVRITPKGEELDPVKRREFVTAAASIAFIPSHPVEPHKDPAYLRELAKTVARDRYERGGITSVAPAMRHVQRIKHVLESRDEQLQAAASSVAVEAVWTLNDVGRLGDGEKVGRLALELANRSGDADAQSKAYSVLAQVQHHRGEADRGLWYSQHGVKLHEVPAGQQLWMRQRLGESLSKVPGQERAARAELENLRAAVADAHSHGELSPFDTADMTGCVGRVLCDLGAYPEAQAALDEAIAGLGHSAPLLHGYYLAHQIKASLRAAEPAVAAHQIRTLARIAPVVDSVLLNRYLTEVLALSAQWRRVPEMREAHQHLRSVTPTPSAKR